MSYMAPTLWRRGGVKGRWGPHSMGEEGMEGEVGHAPC